MGDQTSLSGRLLREFAAGCTGSPGAAVKRRVLERGGEPSA